MIAFIRMHPNLVFLWHKGRNFRDVMGDCQLAIPNNFIRSILARETGLLLTRFCFRKS